jgi:hypothetical protein
MVMNRSLTSSESDGRATLVTGRVFLDLFRTNPYLALGQMREYINQNVTIEILKRYFEKMQPKQMHLIYNLLEAGYHNSNSNSDFVHTLEELFGPINSWKPVEVKGAFESMFDFVSDAEPEEKARVLAIIQACATGVPEANIPRFSAHYRKFLKMLPEFQAVQDKLPEQIHQNRDQIVARWRKSRKQVDTMNEQCRNSTALLGDAWGKIPRHRRYGPMSDGYCYDAADLVKIMMEDFAKGELPSSPFTRTVFTYGVLDDIITHLQNNAIPHPPILPIIVYGFTHGYIRGSLAHGDVERRFDMKTRINRYMEGAMRDWKKGLSEAH